MGFQGMMQLKSRAREHFQMLVKTPEQNSWLPLSQSFSPTNQTQDLSLFFRA